MRIIVLGGDGFCGWPTSLYLSGQGHDVHIVDNFSRRNIEVQTGSYSLTPIASMEDRLAAWKSASGRELDFTNLALGRDYPVLLSLLRLYKPDAIVHFAEQRSAPYSMRGTQEKRYTVLNNMTATHDVCAAIVESGIDTHLVHLGTMGVYGYSTSNAPIPEGYLSVKIRNRNGEWKEQEILHPAYPGSIYHMTKCQDQLTFQFYNKNDGLRITDLHQGIVWGIETDETSLDPRLINRFDYDGDYGTVLNRFIMQASCGYPLTVHGTGGQTRAFIHIRDTVRCISLAIQNPPKRGDRVNILNQATETHRVRDLAKMVAEKTGCTIANVPNPRNEAEENELDVVNDNFMEMGLSPTLLEANLVSEVLDIVGKYRERVLFRSIPCHSGWNRERKNAIKC